MGTLGENGLPVWYWLIGAAALAALLGLVYFNELETGTESSVAECEVTGRVADESDRPVIGYELTVRASSGKRRPHAIAVSEPEGRFELSLPAGTFVLSFAAEGYALCEKTVTVAHERVWIPITLRK